MPLNPDNFDTPDPPVSNAALDSLAGFQEAEMQLRQEQSMDLARALLYEHPDYLNEFPKWQKYYDVYESEDLSRYLRRHPRETNDTFEARVARAYFYNYCASVVNLFVAYLFKAPINRKLSMSSGTTSEELEEFRKNADLRGSSYESVMQKAATYAQVFGHCGILVDVPEADSYIVSEQDRKDAGLRPYLTVIDATQIKDWALDEFGNFEWVKIEIAPVDVRSFQMTTTDKVRCFVIWDREGWTKYHVIDEKYAEVVGAGDSPPGIRGRVPLVIFRNEEKLRHDWFGSSSLKDIADINLAILNWASYGDEEIVNRCLNILTMQRDQMGDSAPTMSHYNIIEYPAEGQPPSYLVPGETPLKLIAEWIDKGKDEIYRLAAMGGSTGLLGVREATSGIAYAYEFNETNQSLAKKAESMEKGEVELFNLIAAWYGAEFTGSIAYPREFGVDDFIMELDLLLKARDTLTSETAIKEFEKIVVGKLFARNDTTFREKLEKEIDEGEAKPVSPLMGFGQLPPGMASPDSEETGEKPEENEEDEDDE